MKILSLILSLTLTLFANHYSSKKIIPLAKAQSFKLTRLDVLDLTKSPLNLKFLVAYQEGFSYQDEDFKKSAKSLALGVAKALRTRLDLDKALFLAYPLKPRVSGYEVVSPASFMGRFSKVRTNKRLIIKLQNFKLRSSGVWLFKTLSFKAFVRYELKGFKKGLIYDELVINASFKAAGEKGFLKTEEIIASELAKEVLKAIKKEKL